VNLGIAGQSVERISFDYAVTLQTDGGAEIRIETEFSLRMPSGEVDVVEPERLGGGAERLTAILHEMITGASVAESDGTLVLEFVNRVELQVSSSEAYEAWTFTAPGGLKVVALPGGGVTSWDPEA
jgi:hypothetical protein